MSKYLLGYDIGSSSVKAALVNADTRESVAVTQSPLDSMPMESERHGWAEQDPEMWWSHVCIATRELLKNSGVDPAGICGIGIGYQMHGLVCVDRNAKVLRPAIIWCDSRAVGIGDRAFLEIGESHCLEHLLNSPGNFTASKLSWVKENEPEVYQNVFKFLLPGDFIAMKLTGDMLTTASGLSEGIFWDFKDNAISQDILSYFNFNRSYFPEVVGTMAHQGVVTEAAAGETGLRAGIPVTYRAGDQPNNALALNVFEPGEVAASGGTSGVIYGIVDRPAYDLQSRVNCFMHVNHSDDHPRIGILLCINGAGSQYNWIRKNIAEEGKSYEEMEAASQAIAIGSEGLVILPFGNGAERMLENSDPGATIAHLDFNRHSRAHFFRAALEGIAFGFAYGMEVMAGMGMHVSTLRVGNDNLFRSAIFSETVSTLLNCRIEVVQTTGAVGAALAAGVAPGIFDSAREALHGQHVLMHYDPAQDRVPYDQAYARWKATLNASRAEQN